MLLSATCNMYNGIGLLTPRGSGTSGHVTGNSFNIRGGQRITERKDEGKQPPRVLKADEKILEHQRKRAVEVKLAELEESLQDKGCATEHSSCQHSMEAHLTNQHNPIRTDRSSHCSAITSLKPSVGRAQQSKVLQ